MNKLVIAIFLFFALPLQVCATEYTPPVAPDSAQKYMPQETDNFGEGLLFVLQKAFDYIDPAVSEAAGVCISTIAIIVIISMTENVTAAPKQVIELVAAISVSIILLRSANSLITLGMQTITELNDYGKLLIPVMTAALAAQGGFTSSATLYSGTAFFASLLTTAITKLMLPMVYIYLCLAIAGCALQQDAITQMKAFVKWLMTWCLKIILYTFTGYMTITGVITGTTDASALKATKIAISGFVPVIGNILSDASESVLISAGLMKNAAGIYGILAAISICIGPFLRIGMQYLMLKLSASICGIFGSKKPVALVSDFASAMGFLLAMTGTVCILLLISTVCFMKGVS